MKINMRIISIFLVASILMIALFSFTFMDMEVGHICPISVFTGANCIIMADDFSMANYHLSSIQKFITAVFKFGNDLSVILSLVLTALFLHKLWLPNDLSGLTSLITRYLLVGKLAVAMSIAPFLKWLSLRNKCGSDNFYQFTGA